MKGKNYMYYFLEKEKMLKSLRAAKIEKKWRAGVVNAACMIIESGIEGELFVFEKFSELEKKLLNGASNWREYSYGGSALIWNYDICNNYCTLREQKKLKYGIANPNGRETWADVQARGLYQAYELIKTNCELLMQN